MGFYFKMNIGIKLDIGVQLYSAVLLLVYYVVYRKQLKILWKNTGKNSQDSTQEAADSQVIYFKNIFANKSAQELQNIIQDENRVPPAIQAAKELLEKKT